MRLPRWDVALYFWGEKRGTGSVTGLNPVDNKPSSFLTQHLFSLPGECAAPLMCVRLCQQKKDLVAGDASDSCPFIFYWVNLNVLQDAHGDKAGMHTSADRNASIVHVHLYMNTYRCTCTRSPTPSPRGGAFWTSRRYLSEWTQRDSFLFTRPACLPPPNSPIPSAGRCVEDLWFLSLGR